MTVTDWSLTSCSRDKRHTDSVNADDLASFDIQQFFKRHMWVYVSAEVALLKFDTLVCSISPVKAVEPGFAFQVTAVRVIVFCVWT